MNEQQYFSIALTTFPVVMTVLIGIILNNGRLNDLSARIADMHARFTEVNARISETNVKINELRGDMNDRFDEMRSLWRSELHRVEQILDARLKHLEER